MKSLQVQWIIRLILLVLVIAVLGGAHWQVRRWQSEVQVAQIEVDKRPAQALETTRLRTDLRDNQSDIVPVLELVPLRDEVVAVVSAIEEEGKSRGLQAGVVDIAEVSAQEGQTESGPLQAVELKITASGDPAELTEFLYTVEHLPYLLHGKTWRLRVGESQVESPAAGELAPETQGAPVDLTVPEGQLVADFVLMVRSSDLVL